MILNCRSWAIVVAFAFVASLIIPFSTAADISTKNEDHKLSFAKKHQVEDLKNK